MSFPAGRETVCLAMLVKDEASIIDRCLQSVRPFVDTWVIADCGSRDDTPARVRAALDGIEGSLELLDFEGFDVTRNKIRDLSQGRADYVLWLDADEELQVDPGASVALDADAYQLEIRSTPRALADAGALVRPRLCRDDADYVFWGSSRETMVGVEQASLLQDITLLHHCDGYRWRDPASRQREVAALDLAIADAPRSLDLLLARADARRDRGDLWHALEDYRRVAKLEVSQDVRWYSLYQAARMLDRSDADSALVFKAYSDALEVDVDRIEPMVRMARRLRLSQRPKAALQLLDEAAGTGEPKRVLYYEPQLWDVEASIERVKCHLAAGDGRNARRQAEQALAQAELDSNSAEALRQLRERAREMTVDARTAASPTAQPSPQRRAEAPKRQPLEPTPWRTEPKRLCIGMCTYSDYDGVYFTIQALRMYHADLMDDVELLIIDNDPTGPAAKFLKALERSAPNLRYVPVSEVNGTSAKDYVFREANADFVLVIDCHVFVVPGALHKLFDYLERHPQTDDLLQGPLVYDNLKAISTHFDPGWSGGMWGRWATDPRGEDPTAEPFEVPMQGCGLFAARRDSWLGLNPRFRGFGVEEGYLHQKYHQRGSRVMCLPFLRWMHRFNRPLGIPYRLDPGARVRNYLIGWRELGMDEKALSEHFQQEIGAQAFERVAKQVEREMNAPLYGFDQIVLAQDDVFLSPEKEQKLLQRLAIARRTIRLQRGRATAESTLEFSRVLHRFARSAARHCLVIEDLEGLAELEDAAILKVLSQLEDGAEHVELGVQAGSANQGAGESGKRAKRVAWATSREFAAALANEIPDEREAATEWLRQQAANAY